MIKLLKVVLTFLIILILPAFAAEDYWKMNNYETGSYNFNPYTMEYTLSETLSKKELKKYKKIKKLYKKQKYGDILSIEANFLPALYSILINSENKKNYNSAVIYAKKIQTLYPDFNTKALGAKLVEDLVASKQYNDALIELKKIGESYPCYNYYSAECKFNLGLYSDAIYYAQKVKSYSDTYIKSQVIIFKCLYRQNNFKEAYNKARHLISIDPENPKHYLRAASCTENPEEKLTYLYKARALTNNKGTKLEINSAIVTIEQYKINKAVKNSKKFIETPNWYEIISPVSAYGSDNYWMSRQDSFYKATNNCMKNYTGSELSACFTSIVNKQNTLNQQLLQQEQMNQENQYRQAILEQNERMIYLQRMQNINQMQINNNLQNINNNLRQQNWNLQNINNSINFHL